MVEPTATPSKIQHSAKSPAQDATQELSPSTRGPDAKFSGPGNTEEIPGAFPLSSDNRQVFSAGSLNATGETRSADGGFMDQATQAYETVKGYISEHLPGTKTERSTFEQRDASPPTDVTHGHTTETCGPGTLSGASNQFAVAPAFEERKSDKPVIGLGSAESSNAPEPLQKPIHNPTPVAAKDDKIQDLPVHTDGGSPVHTLPPAAVTEQLANVSDPRTPMVAGKSSTMSEGFTASPKHPDNADSTPPKKFFATSDGSSTSPNINAERPMASESDPGTRFIESQSSISYSQPGKSTAIGGGVLSGIAAGGEKSGEAASNKNPYMNTSNAGAVETGAADNAGTADNVAKDVKNIGPVTSHKGPPNLNASEYNAVLATDEHRVGTGFKNSLRPEAPDDAPVTEAKPVKQPPEPPSQASTNETNAAPTTRVSIMDLVKGGRSKMWGKGKRKLGKDA